LKKFTFSLEKILKLRSWAEEEAKIELGRAVTELKTIEDSIKKNASLRLEAAEKRFSTGMNRAGDFAVYEAYITRLDLEKQTLLARAEAAALEVEKRTAAWKDAKAGLKTMENLKDRKFKLYRKEAWKNEE